MARKNTQVDASSQAERDALAQQEESDVYRPDEDGGLTAQQWQAVGLLVAGKKQRDVAQAVGVTEFTVSRWRALPAFAAAVNAGVQDAYRATVGDVRSVSEDAVNVLRETLKSEDEKLRLTAALAVLRLRVTLDADVAQLPATPADIARANARRRRKGEQDNMFLYL